MEISYTKAHAVGNDFLIVEASQFAAGGSAGSDLPEFSRAICDRHRGVGADGVELIYPSAEADAMIRLFNSDGSEAEISGNGTRCVAAYLLNRGKSSPLRFATRAGVKTLRLIENHNLTYQFEMSMGRPQYRPEEVGCRLETLQGVHLVTIVNVGNPQCAMIVDDFDFDWCTLGREIETNPRFPNRTNVSFVKVLGRNTIEVRFWERGAGETMSSGTGSSGAVVAAILSGRVHSPVTVVTEAGDMRVSWNDDVLVEGPAQLIANGQYFYSGALSE